MPTIEQQFTEDLKKLARLAVYRGVNLQAGQGLLLTAPLEAVTLADYITETAYAAGAKDVLVIWENDETNRLRLERAPLTALTHLPKWKLDVRNEAVRDHYAVLGIYGPNPDLLEGIDPGRVAAYTKARGEGLIPYYDDMMNDRMQWSLIAYPTRAWAHKVFPRETTTHAQEKLLREVLRISRIRPNVDPLTEWDAHNKRLHAAAAFMNSQHFKQLHYRSQGTDLVIRLPKRHLWSGGSAPSQVGVLFNANIPTEEIYTLPDKRGVDGTVTSKKPLNCNGQVIEEIRLTFKDGQVIDFGARKGEAALGELLASDAGARRLGEVALVPEKSPVAESGLIFYNTLFDENASCHLALGKAYPTCLEGGSSLHAEALDREGVNDSIVHEDFMIGSADLDIDGVRADGTSVPVFRGGEWAFTFPS
ncbi:MAG: aminopeptidase [Sporolactobacillus sp.]